jgi:hypothetical protein
MLQQLYLDVSKVDRVLHLSFPHLLLRRLSWSRQGIHTNEGWVMSMMGTGRGSCVRRVQARELCTDRRCLRSEIGARRRGLGTSQFWEQWRRRVVTWVWRARSPVAQAQRTQFCFDLREGARGCAKQESRPDVGLERDVQVLGLPHCTQGQRLLSPVRGIGPSSKIERLLAPIKLHAPLHSSCWAST